MTEFNLPLAVEVLANIEFAQQQPEDSGSNMWDQGNWGFLRVADLPRNHDIVVDSRGNYVGIGTCNTAMCFAGHALTIERVPLLWEPTDRGYDGALSCDTTADGEDVPKAAARALGIDWHDGDVDDDPMWDYGEGFPRLFSGGNDLDDLYEIVAAHADTDEGVVREMVQRKMATVPRREEG